MLNFPKECYMKDILSWCAIDIAKTSGCLFAAVLGIGLSDCASSTYLPMCPRLSVIRSLSSTTASPLSPSSSPISSSLPVFPGSMPPYHAPSSHNPASVHRALSGSAPLSMSHPLAYLPRNAASLGPVYQGRSPPSRFHPYAPNPVSPGGRPSTPDENHSSSSSPPPSPASSPLLKPSPSSMGVAREIGLNLSTTDSRVVSV